MEASELLVAEGVDAQAVGGDARLDRAGGEIVEDAAILRVEPILAHAQIHRARGDGVAHPAHVSTREPVDDHVGAVAVRTAEVALVGESNPDRERHGCSAPFSLLYYGARSAKDVTGMLNCPGGPRSLGRTPALPACIQCPEEGSGHGDNHG